MSVLNYLVSYIYSRKKISISWRDLFSGIHPCKYIIPLLTILVLNNTGYLYTVFDRTLLGYYTGTENVAYFSLGQKIVELCKLVILSIVFATLPRLSLYLNENPDMYQQTVKRIMKLTLSLMILIEWSVHACPSDNSSFRRRRIPSGSSTDEDFCIKDNCFGDRCDSLQPDYISSRQRKDSCAFQPAVRSRQHNSECNLYRESHTCGLHIVHVDKRNHICVHMPYIYIQKH